MGLANKFLFVSALQPKKTAELSPHLSRQWQGMGKEKSSQTGMIRRAATPSVWEGYGTCRPLLQVLSDCSYLCVNFQLTQLAGSKFSSSSPMCFPSLELFSHNLTHYPFFFCCSRSSFVCYLVIANYARQK